MTTAPDAKWTPGPWPLEDSGDGKRIVVGRGLNEGPRGYEVAEVYSDDCPHELAWANARLISAAPDLYEQLRQARGMLASCGFDRPEDDPTLVAAWDAGLAAIDAALAKARGA